MKNEKQIPNTLCSNRDYIEFKYLTFASKISNSDFDF